MQLSDIRVPQVQDMRQVRDAYADCIEGQFDDETLRQLADIVKKLDQAAWDCDGLAKNGIMIGLLAGLLTARDIEISLRGQPAITRFAAAA